MKQREVADTYSMLEDQQGLLEKVRSYNDVVCRLENGLNWTTAGGG